MSCLRFPWPPVKPACPTCGDAGYLPDPFPARAGDYISCPVCNPDGAADWRWTTTEADEADDELISTGN